MKSCFFFNNLFYFITQQNIDDGLKQTLLPTSEYDVKSNAHELQYHQLDIDFDSFLGQGVFGKVYKAKHGRTSDVAVKIIGDLSENRLKDVKHEIEISSQLQYSCLLTYHGYCHDDKNNILIVMELASGCLKTLKKEMTIDEKLSAAVDVAKCLVAIHGHNPPIIHCDIATRNVLRRADGACALSDFGLAKETSDGTLTFSCDQYIDNTN